MAVRIALNPTSYPPPPPKGLRKRLPSLNGKTVGFLSNNKTNVDILLETVAVRLSERFGIRSRHFNKFNPALGAPLEMLRECAAGCDAAVLAIAD